MTCVYRGRWVAALVPIFVLGLALAAARAVAHHSLSRYDDSRTLVVEGTLKQTKIANPHTWFWVALPATGEGAGSQWAIETAGSAFILRSIGGVLRDQFAPGQKIRVSFHPARDGAHNGLLVQMRFPDGRVLDGVPVK